MTITRRSFLRGMAATLVAAPLVAAGYSLEIEPAWIEITQTDITLPGLDPMFDGFRIVHLSDLHYGGYLPLSRLARTVRLVNSLDADLLALTGDYVSEPRTATYLADRLQGRHNIVFRHSSNAEAVFGVCIPQIAQMRARWGAVAVLGNHDHWVDADVARRHLAQAGITLLENRHQVIEREGAQLVVAGVDDLWEGEQDLERAFAGAPGIDRAQRILLCHNPDFAVDASVAQNRVSLMLSGHTHGGQVYLPGLGAPVLPIQHRQFARGLVPTDWGQVYISRGIGSVAPPVRLLTRPEIALLRLRSANQRS